MRLIDATALHKKLSFMQEQYRAERSNVKARMCKKIIAIIGYMPEIEAEPVRHGRWIPLEGKYKFLGFMECSICKSPLCREDASTAKFCPDCGAKMDGGKENGN